MKKINAGCQRQSTNWPIESSENIIRKAILFFFSPLLAFVVSLWSLKTKSSYVIFFLFFVYFGICFTPLDTGLDAFVYIDGFKTMSYTSDFDLKSTTQNSLLFQGIDKGLYYPLTSFIVSRFTNNYHFLFLFYAIVFAFFSLQSFKMLSREKEFKSSFYCFLLCILFFHNQIFNINGVRFWTAAWVAVFCVLKILLSSRRKYWVLLLLFTPLIHPSFWFFLFIFLLIALTRELRSLWIVLFIISFIFGNISLLGTGDFIVGYLPDSLAHMFEIYTSEEALSRVESQSFLGSVFDGLLHVYRGVIIVYFYTRRKQIASDLRSDNLFSFLLPFITCANFVLPIPSLGARYITLTYPFIAYLWCIGFLRDKFMRNLLVLLPLVFLKDIVVMLIRYSAVLEPEFFYNIPFFLIDKYLLS